MNVERSFSIIDDDDDVSINGGDSDKHDDESEKSLSPKPHLRELSKIDDKPRPGSKIQSPGPSGRQTVLRSRSPMKEKLQHLSSDSEIDDSDNETKVKAKIPGEYDPTIYEDLDVDSEIKEIFQYVVKYTPQQLNLDYKFKPFIPEFLPAVGDIDAFLKVIPPETTLSGGENFDQNALQLGLRVLDEPSANQSDPALLHLQLRAASVNPTTTKNSNVVTKKVDNVEKNVKVIDKWIKDISDLHKSKSSPIVRYSESMPDLDDLMQQWPEDMENFIKENGFPLPDDETSLTEYISIVCSMFQIPVTKNPFQSLHLLFCLYAAIKTTQLYQSNNNEKISNVQNSDDKIEEADKLVLD